jgi:ketosteroid isomerase-like protein
MARSLVALLALLLATPAAAQHGPEAELRAAFDRMGAAWNAGDIAGHVAPYADSAAMMGRTGPFYGRERVRAALERSFWKDGKPLQQLRFEQVAVRMIAGNRAAVVTGRFILSGGDKPDTTGWFTTVWEGQGKVWRIVMDSSA